MRDAVPDHEAIDEREAEQQTRGDHQFGDQRF
jgi:hypothetical protein